MKPRLALAMETIAKQRSREWSTYHCDARAPVHPAALQPECSCAPQLCSLRAALPCRSRAALPCSPCPALPSCPHALQPARCPARVALQPVHCPALQPAHCPALQPARCPALQLARCPALPPALQPARCPACAALQPARCPALQPARCPAHVALQPTSCPACAAMQPAHCPALQPLQRLPLLLQLQLHSFVSGLFSEAVLVVEDMFLEVLDISGRRVSWRPPSPQHPREWFSQRRVSDSVGATALGAGESAAALGASETATTGASESATSESAASAEALHTFTLDSGVSHCFFRDCTTVTPLAALVQVSLADPSGGPDVARASTVLPCPAVPSGSVSGLHLPSFSTNLVSNAVHQDVWVDTFTPGGQHVAICTCSRTGRHLATFTRQSGSSLYTLTIASAPVNASGQVAALSPMSASGQFAASFSCQVLSHQPLLWHHRLGHPSLLRLHSMHYHLLVSVLPRSLPPLPRSLAPPWLPCVKGRQRTAPRSSFPLTTVPLQTLHMDVWGPAPVHGTDQEHYFLLVVDDYTHYTVVFPLRNKAAVRGVLIPWIRATRHQLCKRFWQDLSVLRLHFDRGGEFSSGLLAEFCQDEGILQPFTLPASTQQNGIAERRIGLIMEVARTSMIHAAAPHFLWPFAARHGAHHLNLWPRISLPETSPTLRWTGEVGDASAFWVWGALSLVRDTTASKLSHRTLRCAFLGFPTDALPWQFYHPHSRRVLSSRDVTFDKSVCFYRLHPHVSHPVDPPPLLEPLVISSDTSGPAEGGDPTADNTATTRRSPRLETPPGFPPRLSSPPLQPVAVDTGAAGGEDIGGAGPGGAETGGGEIGGAGPGGAETGGEGFGGADSGGANSGGAASPNGGGAVGAPAAGPGVGQQQPPSRMETPSPQQLCEWVNRQGRSGAGAWSFTAPGAATSGGTWGAGAAGTGGAGATGAGGTGGTGGAGGAGPRGARTRGTGAAKSGGVAGVGGAGGARAAGTGGAGAAGEGYAGDAAGARGAGAGGTGGAGDAGPRGARTRGAGAAGAGGATGAGGAGGALGGARGAGAAGTGGAGAAGAGGAGGAGAAGAGGAEGAAGARGAGAGGTGGTGAVRVRVPRRADFFSTRSHRRPCHHLTRPLASLVPPHLFVLVVSPVLVLPAVPGTHVMALRPSSVPQCVALPSPPAPSLPNVPEPESDLARAASPTVTRPLATVVTDPDFDSTAALALVTELVDFAAMSRLDCVASLVTKSESVCPPSVDGEPALSSDVLEDRVKQPPGSLPAFKVRYVARGFNQQQGFDFFQTFSLTPKMTTLRVLLHVAAQRDYKLHSLDFSTAFLQGRATFMRRSGCAAHQASLGRFLRVPSGASGGQSTISARHLASVPMFVEDLVFTTADTEALALVKAELQERHICIYLGELRGYLGLQITLDRARCTITMTQSHMVHQVLQCFGFQYSSPQPTPLPTGHSLSAPPSDESLELSGPYPELVGCLICEAEIYAGAMAAQELRWLTYLLTNLGERPRSPPVLYVDNKAMLALCHEQRREHITKHIALRYFLARELQRPGHLRLSYMASQASITDVFTKALGYGDHQRFCIALGLLPTLPHLLVS
ncbi:unnamed protein product [Closterium sp. NIES-53]